jgi:hypothetical protein
MALHGNTPVYRGDAASHVSHFKARLILASIGSLALATGATLLILYGLGIIVINSVGQNALGALMTLLGVACTFGQWLFPFPAAFPSPASAGTAPEPLNLDSQAHEAFRQHVQNELDSRLLKGTVIVYMDDHYVGQEIHLVTQRAWTNSHLMPIHPAKIRTAPIKRYRILDRYVCAAVFRNLDEDDYITWFDATQPTSIPVFSNEVTVIYGC